MMPTQFHSIYRYTVYRYGILPTIRVTIYRVIAINTEISIYRPALLLEVEFSTTITNT